MYKPQINELYYILTKKIFIKKKYYDLNYKKKNIIFIKIRKKNNYLDFHPIIFAYLQDCDGFVN